MSNETVTANQLVAAYMNAYKSEQTIGDVAIAVGMSKGSVVSRINYLRERGVNLPPLVNGVKRLDVDELNGLIESALK